MKRDEKVPKKPKKHLFSYLPSSTHEIVTTMHLSIGICDIEEKKLCLTSIL